MDTKKKRRKKRRTAKKQATHTTTKTRRGKANQRCESQEQPLEASEQMTPSEETDTDV
ncbi:hypothetical protein [Numidum massiliense]|uniref:hypothetical protein n=1 Tax=Numidum massiliense TaxID=1522315 RepID=UPI0012F9ACAD|nr:hypothetical protein [Numidum massiliense]